jgi:predicted short-subunit dehydrogenase-like oxidoreductase (DUF2520 family)
MRAVRGAAIGCSSRVVWYAPGVKQTLIAVVGIGRLGRALAQRLSESGYEVSKVRSRKSGALATNADVVWFCVPDSQITRVAARFADQPRRTKCAFHSSGVLTSDALDCLRRSGAAVASVHPLMTFVAGSVPELGGVPFAIEGDARAVRAAREIVRELAGRPVGIKKKDKIAYHAFATMICPLLVSLLASAENAAELAGMSETEARRRMMPIIRQTLRNYEKLGPAGAFSGPIVRGDVETVQAHLGALRTRPRARAVYIELAKAALENLPSANSSELARLLRR